MASRGGGTTPRQAGPGPSVTTAGPSGLASPSVGRGRITQRISFPANVDTAAVGAGGVWAGIGTSVVRADPGTGTVEGGRHPLADARLWIGILLIVGSLVYYQYWQAAQQARDIEETDAAILSSDLPIEAYLDRGFQNWLRHSEP